MSKASNAADAARRKAAEFLSAKKGKWFTALELGMRLGYSAGAAIAGVTPAIESLVAEGLVEGTAGRQFRWKGEA